MGNFNYFDLISVGIILVSAIFAYSRGIVREFTSIAVWVIAAIVAYVSAPGALPLVGHIPVLGEFLEDSCQLSVIAAFTIAFSVTLIVLTFLASMLVKLANLPAIGAIDKGVGIMFGVLRGAFVIVLILVANDFLFASGQSPTVVSDSRSAELLDGAKVALQQLVPADTPEWLENIYGSAMNVCAPQQVET
ncbi:MAG: CvpA family protein [Rhodobacteraceae bacterium]|nr:CvpA family protein [Paracoccaceae bacterium]